MASDTSPVFGVIYARYSSLGQRDESIEGQLRDCRAYAEQHGITILAEYCDRAMTGTSDKRPEFQRMIRDSAKKRFSVVLTWKNDRFARSRYDSAIYKARLKQNGVRLLYAKETIPDGPEGIILESMMEGFAEYYSANLSQNVKRGNYDSALKRQTLGQSVLGLRAGPDKRFEIDPATAPIVRRIFEEYSAGRPAKAIYTDLNRDGYRTARGKAFTKNSLRVILKNEKYAGVYAYADIRDEHGIPPIVDRELFDAAQRMLARHHHTPAAAPTDGGFLLTGKLYCGECGQPMTGDSGTSKGGSVYRYYTCNGRRRRTCDKTRAPKQWIEDVVVAELAKIVHSDEMIAAIADRFMEWQRTQRPTSAAEGLRKRLRETEQAISNLVRVLEDGLSSDSIRSRLVELEATRRDLEAGIARAEVEEPELDRDAVVWWLEQFRAGDQSDPAWRIYLVDTFLQAAYLYDDGRLLLHLNVGGDVGKISVQTAEDATASGVPLCSDFARSRLPEYANLNTMVFFFQGAFVVLTSAARRG